MYMRGNGIDLLHLHVHDFWVLITPFPSSCFGDCEYYVMRTISSFTKSETLKPPSGRLTNPACSRMLCFQRVRRLSDSKEITLT